MTSGNEKLTLAIETAIGGGGLVLSRGGEIVAELTGVPEISRAAGLIPAIDALLKSSGVALKDLSSIAVSVGPGSYTGIRVGISTALGLARSVGIQVFGVSALRALATARASQDTIIAALPVGREDIAWQIFNNDTAASVPRVGSIEGLADALRKTKATETVIHHIGLDGRLAPLPDTIKTVAVSDRLAALIALAANNGLVESDLTPLYLLNPARARNLF